MKPGERWVALEDWVMLGNRRWSLVPLWTASIIMIVRMRHVRILVWRVMLNHYFLMDHYMLNHWFFIVILRVLVLGLHATA
jgi:hypothetical protein